MEPTLLLPARTEAQIGEAFIAATTHEAIAASLERPLLLMDYYHLVLNKANSRGVDLTEYSKQAVLDGPADHSGEILVKSLRKGREAIYHVFKRENEEPGETEEVIADDAPEEPHQREGIIVRRHLNSTEPSFYSRYTNGGFNYLWAEIGEEDIDLIREVVIAAVFTNLQETIGPVTKSPRITLEDLAMLFEEQVI